MKQLNFKKLTLVLAISSVFDVTSVSAALVTTPAIKDLPQGTSSVDVVLTGTSNKANQWTGSINGAFVDNSFIFGQGFRPTANGKPVALDNISVKIKDFTDGMDLMAGVNIGDIKDNGYLALTVSNSTFNRLVDDGNSYNAYMTRVSAERDLQLSATLNVEKVNIDKSHWVYGFYDNAKDAKRTYTQVRQNIDELTGGSFIANLLGGGNGFAQIENLDVNMSRLDLVNVYGLANTKGGIAQVGNYAINVKDSKLQSLYGLALQAGNGQFTLAGDYRFNVEKVTADRINALAINAPSFVADGDVFFSLRDTIVTGAEADGRFATISFAPNVEGKKYVFNGNVITEINNSSSAYDFSTLRYALIKNNNHKYYETEFNNSRIALELHNSTARRVYTMMITNSLEQGAKPHFTLNNGSIELLLDGHSSGTGDRSEDNPTVMCLGSNANVELNNSDVRLTLRANKNNALSDQSIYGIAMHGANSKVKLDGDIVVTLEGDAKDLGFGVKADGSKKNVGGIYAIGKQNVDTSVFEQTGDRVLQFGSLEHTFISSENNGLVAPFANFTHVSVGAGSSLYLTQSQNDNFVHDDAFGSAGAVLNAVGVSAKGGSLTVAGGTDADKVGIRLADNSTLHASKIDFTGQSTVASVGSATLSGDSVKVAADAKVNFKTLDASLNNAINLSGLIENEGVFSLDGSGIALSADKNQKVNLGKVETVGQKESAIYTGSGNLLIEDFKGDNKAVVITDLEKADSVVIQNNSGNLNLAASSSANDQFNSAQDAADALAGKFTVENTDQKEHQLTVQEGTINDAVTGKIDKNGEVTDLVFHKNTTLDAYSSVATLSAFQWRHEINSVNKRMGELRLSPNGVGAWARLYGSEQVYGAQNVTAKNHSVQVGFDTDVGNGWKVGAAFNYTDGQSTYGAGNGDNKAYGLTAYGTWMADNGQYVDLTAKYSRLDNDFTVNQMAGDYSNNAYSVSAEYGWHFKMSDVAFVEPQVEVMYGKVMGDNFKANNGVNIEQEDFESLITRAGVRSGFYFPENKGVIYARASVLHDFKGEMESTARFEKAVNSVKDDIGGTWYELGLGANFNMSPTSYIYVDLERTNGGAVVENWRYNLGFRKVF